MAFGVRPRLESLRGEEWQRHYPNGLGASAFSAPGWQALMRGLVERDFELCGLVAEAGSTRFSLPVFAREWRYGRVELVTHPIAYYVLPIECEAAEASFVPMMLAASRSPLTGSFKWWLPPWLTGDRSELGDDVDTYVIEIEGDVDEYLQRTVRKRYLEYVRSSYRRGIEVVEQPSSREVEEYFELYGKTFNERSWVGDQFPLEFFHGVATTLGDGGKLVLFRYQGRVVGGGVVLFDRYAVHYFQGATERENNDVKPHLVLYDWLVRAASSRGLKYINLGGINEGNESLAQFKRSWGAKPRPVPHVCWVRDRQWLEDRLGLARFRDWAWRSAPAQAGAASAAPARADAAGAANAANAAGARLAEGGAAGGGRAARSPDPGE